MILVHGKDLVDDVLIAIAPSLTLLDLLWLTAALGDKIVNIQHHCSLVRKG